ncbi:hypothetical protein V6N12_058663 [Hibiscus sabdariffa]|uniref:Uncharacterized protein n=1 Tax=Hibiscus sabdariffa TaxID=183260 RepID=A0ABR2EST1_9ROSI
MIKLGKDELKVDLIVGVCRRARELAKEKINRNYKYEFKRLFDYANALRRADTDGIIDLLVDRPTPNHRPRAMRAMKRIHLNQYPKLMFILSLRTTVPTPPTHHVPIEEPSTPHCSTEPTIPPAPIKEPPTPNCSNEPIIPLALTYAATHHASTAHVPSNKKGKEKKLRSYLMDLGRKRSADITDDVPNTQESNTGTNK